MRILAALCLASLALACDRPAYEIARPWIDDPEVTLDHFQVGDASRPAVRLGPGETRTFPLGAVERGSLTTWLAVDPAPESEVEAEIRLRAGDAAVEGSPACRTRWPGGPAASGWQRCGFDIARDLGPASLEVRFGGDASAQLLVASPILRSSRAADRPPVFVLTIDTLRFDPLSIYREKPGIGSSLEALARDAIVFENAWSNSSWTRTAMASFFTGLWPQRHRVFDRLDVLAPGLLTLPEILQRHGYTTLAWSANPNFLPMWGFGQGFDAFFDVRAAQWSIAKTDGEEVFQHREDSLAGIPEGPTFHYIHLMDPHAPYGPPRKHWEAVRGDHRLVRTFPSPRADRAKIDTALRAYVAYLGEVVDVDAQLGRFLERLKDLGVYDDALVLVLSDHGEEFLEHGWMWHGRTLYEEVLRIPVVMKLPGGRSAGRRIADPVGLDDLMPTLLHALGISPPPGVDGRVLLDREIPPRLQVAVLDLDGRRFTAVRSGSWKLIVGRDGETELYDLERDPGEHSDVGARYPERTAELGRALELSNAVVEYGWHLRGCGTAEEGTLELLVGVEEAAVQTRLTEDEDSVVESAEPGASEQHHRVTWHLRPERRLNFRSPESEEVLVEDEDEIVLAPTAKRAASPLRVAAAHGREILFAVGPGPEWKRAVTLELDARAVALPVAGDVGCGDAAEGPGADETYVRVWYTPPPETLEVEDVDPSVRERLRELGYAW